MGLDAREMTTLVAAAASAPSSLISRLDLCLMLETTRGPSAKFAKFGAENSSPKPDRKKRNSSNAKHKNN